MTMMTHNSYGATVELDEDAGLFHGEVINTGRTDLSGAHDRRAQGRFADTVADYIKWCRRRGKDPAGRSGKSVDTFVAETLERSA